MLGAFVTTVAAWCFTTMAVAVLLIAPCRRLQFCSAKPWYVAYSIGYMIPTIGCCYYAVCGRTDWIMKLPTTLNERMYVHDDAAEQIALIQISLQIYATLAAIVSGDKSLAKPEMFAHRASTGKRTRALCISPRPVTSRLRSLVRADSITLVGMLICLNPLGQSYCGAFFGLTEFSTIPLIVTDTIKQYKGLNLQYPKTDLIAKTLFGLSFLAFRIGLTLPLSYCFQRDLYALYATGTAHSVPAVAFSSLANVFVCGLQCFWSTLIIKGLGKVLSGGKAKAKGS